MKDYLLKKKKIYAFIFNNYWGLRNRLRLIYLKFFRSKDNKIYRCGLTIDFAVC